MAIMNAGKPAALPPQGGGSKTQQTGTTNTKTVVATVPFSRASKEHWELGPSQTGTLSANTSTLNFRVPAYGYIQNVYLLVTVASSGNSANVAMQSDAPWSFFSNVLFKDSNSTPIHNLSGYQLYLANKFGGYRIYPLDSGDGYSAPVTGTGGTGGSFSFIMPVPVQFGRDSLGVLTNQDASAPYQIDVTVAPLASLYSTAPTNAPTYTIQLLLEARMQPAATDMFGNANEVIPPAEGTCQFWSVTTYPVTASENNIQLARLGNYIRNLILVWRNASGVRTMLASNFILEFDTIQLRNETPTTIAFRNYGQYGYSAPTGALALPFTLDPDGVPGNEYGDRWLPTLNTSRVVARFTASAAGTLEIITNDVIPQGQPFAQ